MRPALASTFSLAALLSCGTVSAQVIDHSNPSSGNSDMVANQSYEWGPIFLGGICRLTDKGSSETGTIFTKAQYDIRRFETSFVFQILGGGPDDTSKGEGNSADGMTFIIQNQGIDARGDAGGSLGYAGIAKSIAVKFDSAPNLWDGNPDPSYSSTGIYKDGEIPAGGYDLLRDGINLRSQHFFRVDMRYDGEVLMVRITDKKTGDVSNQKYKVDIPSIVGGPKALIGFSAATGLGTASHDLHKWYFASTPVVGSTKSGRGAKNVSTVAAKSNKGETIAAWPTVTEHPGKTVASVNAPIRVSVAK